MVRMPVLARKMRSIAMVATLLSLFAPWYPFSDGGVAPGWWALLAALVSTSMDWLIYRLAFLLLAAVLVAATLVALNVASLGTKVGRWQPVLLLVALAVLLGVVPGKVVAPWGTLWGVWLTTTCLGVAVILEAAMLVASRLRHQT